MSTRTEKCQCGATITAPEELLPTMIMAHNVEVHGMEAPPVIPEPKTEDKPVQENSSEPKPVAPPPPPELVETLVSQLEMTLSMIQVPARVEATAKEFIASLREWSAEGVKPNG